MTPSKHSCCSYCGHPFLESPPWPRTCGRCAQVSYLNPAPVAVALVPVDGGLLCIRRNIEPGVGLLALPGGFMEVGETWQEATARELFEETGVRLEPSAFQLFRVLSPRDEPFLLIFGLAGERTAASLPAYVANAETTETVIVRAPVELAFPLHTQAVREFFAERAGRQKGTG